MELSSWFGLVNTLAHALMFIITKTAFSNRALIKTWYYLDRLLLFNGQCSCQKDRRINILGFCVRWREGLLVSRAMKRFQGTNTECSPCEAVERRSNLGFTPFFAFLLYVVPFVSFSSQDSLNILARETVAFIDSRRRKRSWFWSFFPFLSSCLFLFPAPYLATGQRKRPGPPPMSGSGRGSRLWTVGASWGRDLVGAGNQGLPDRGSLSARTSQSTNWPRVTNAWRIGFSISVLTGFFGQVGKTILILVGDMVTSGNWGPGKIRLP